MKHQDFSQRQVGDRVCLRHDYPSLSSLGKLNTVMLQSEGYEGSADIVQVTGTGYVVKLPSGYELTIGVRDIFKVLPPEDTKSDRTDI